MPIKSLNNKDSYYNYLAESGSLQGTLYNWGGNRGIWAGGSNGGPYELTIDYVSIPTTGNATDFGDLSDARQYPAAVSNGQRGVIAGGDSGPKLNVIDYITIPTLGNAFDFGDLNNTAEGPASCSSNVRGCFGGGAWMLRPATSQHPRLR